MKPDLVIDTPSALARVFADRFAAAASTALAARGRFTCALPGGSVAQAFFPTLARTSVDWPRVDFFWCDERAVAPDHPDSNYGLAKRLLLDPVGADPRRVHRIAGESRNLEAAARGYEEEMLRVLGDPPAVDLVLLGLGPDGHVCSLFPGHPLLRERARRVAAITDSPKPPLGRITFTLLSLALAGTLCVAAFGDSKARAMHEALEDPASQAPAALALRAAQHALVMVDEAAARLLEETRPTPRGR